MHIIVCGSTGSRTSNFLKHIIHPALQTSAKIHAIDQQQVDFLPHHTPPNMNVYTADQSLNALDAVLDEINKRKSLFLEQGIVKIEDWKGRNQPPRILLVIDEYASTFKIKNFENKLIEIIQTGRKWGIYVIIESIRPDAKIMEGQIADCLQAYMLFRSSHTNVRILKKASPHKLPRERKGLGFWILDDKPILLQTPKAKTMKITLKDSNKQTNQYPSLDQNTKNHHQQHNQALHPTPSLDQNLVPAQKRDPRAIFTPHDKLTKLLGTHPQKIGFIRTRPNILGKRTWGYWVKQKT